MPPPPHAWIGAGVSWASGAQSLGGQPWGAGLNFSWVTQTKSKGDVNYVGIDGGMNSLIRPALYGAWHAILNLSRLGEPADHMAHVVGPICETGDTLGYNRRLVRPSEGDVLLIATAGAYGRSMSSHYNLRAPAGEQILPAKDSESLPD